MDYLRTDQTTQSSFDWVESYDTANQVIERASRSAKRTVKAQVQVTRARPSTPNPFVVDLAAVRAAHAACARLPTKSHSLSDTMPGEPGAALAECPEFVDLAPGEPTLGEVGKALRDAAAPATVERLIHQLGHAVSPRLRQIVWAHLRRLLALKMVREAGTEGRRQLFESIEARSAVLRSA